MKETGLHKSKKVNSKSMIINDLLKHSPKMRYVNPAVQDGLKLSSSLFSSTYKGSLVTKRPKVVDKSDFHDILKG
jgi:hypothetical protein